MKFKKLLAMAFASVMALSLVACGDSETSSTGNDGNDSGASGNDTIVIGSTELNGVFSPLFYQTSYDGEVFAPIFSNISKRSDDNTLVDDAGNISAEEIKDENGEVIQTKYTIKLKEGIKFSDGQDLTIDDVIFTMHAKADPTYSGLSTFSTLDIVGLDEYLYDSPGYSAQIAEIEKQSEELSDEEFQTFVDEYISKQLEEEKAEDINTKMSLGLDAEAVDFEQKLKDKLKEIYIADEGMRTTAKNEKFKKLRGEYIDGNISDGIDVESISGIEKVDEYTGTVLLNGVSIVADRQIANEPILPEHYYGVADDGTKYTKGDLTIPKSRNGTPMGSGPYKFVEYNNNIVTLEANPDYFGGVAKTPFLKFQVVSQDDKVDVVVKGEMDITDPTAKKETIERLEAEGIEYNLVDNNGYNYIGINSELVPDINVRKGLMHLINREPAIKGYFGDLAEIIERPTTTTLAEYPADAEEYYGYSKEKAVEYFTKAGYSKNAEGKLVNANGEQLRIEFAVSDLATSPVAGIATQMQNDLDELGAEFIVTDAAFNVIVDRIVSGNVDMFTIGWGNVNDADFTQTFHSSMANGVGSNHYNLKDPEVDALLEEAARTLDLEKRKEIVAKELDLIMENAVIMPLYQRKNLHIFNTDTLNIDTVYRSPSPYHTYADEYQTIEMN